MRVERLFVGQNFSPRPTFRLLSLNPSETERGAPSPGKCVGTCYIVSYLQHQTTFMNANINAKCIFYQGDWFLYRPFLKV